MMNAKRRTERLRSNRPCSSFCIHRSSLDKRKTPGVRMRRHAPESKRSPWLGWTRRSVHPSQRGNLLAQARAKSRQATAGTTGERSRENASLSLFLRSDADQRARRLARYPRIARPRHGGKASIVPKPRKSVKSHRKSLWMRILRANRQRALRRKTPCRSRAVANNLSNRCPESGQPPGWMCQHGKQRAWRLNCRVGRRPAQNHRQLAYAP